MMYKRPPAWKRSTVRTSFEWPTVPCSVGCWWRPGDHYKYECRWAWRSGTGKVDRCAGGALWTGEPIVAGGKSTLDSLPHSGDIITFFHATRENIARAAITAANGLIGIQQMARTLYVVAALVVVVAGMRAASPILVPVSGIDLHRGRLGAGPAVATGSRSPHVACARPRGLCDCGSHSSQSSPSLAVRSLTSHRRSPNTHARLLEIKRDCVEWLDGTWCQNQAASRPGRP